MNYILVVDDEIDIREALVEILKREEYSVESARNGQDALDFLKAAKRLPQLIILDLFMPIMDGKEFLNILTQDPKMNHIPILVVSGSEQAIPHPPKHCQVFRKPFPAHELLLTVKTLLKPGEFSEQ